MKTFIYLLVVMVVFLTLTSAQSGGQETIEGTYVVFSKDLKVETDEFQVVPGKLYRDDIRSIGATGDRTVGTMEYENGTLVGYEQTRNGLPAIRASNDKKFFKLYEHDAMVGMFPVEDDVLVLDPNMYSQFAFIIRVFEEKKKEKVRLSVCVPQVSDFLYVDVERRGSDAIPIGKKTVNCIHYRIAVGKKEVVNCWFIGERLLGMYLATKNVYVTDAAYDRIYEHIKKLVNRAM